MKEIVGWLFDKFGIPVWRQALIILVIFLLGILVWVLPVHFGDLQ